MQAKPDTEPITHVTGKYVQMNMKDFLPCRLAVCEADIYSFTVDPTLTQCRGNTLRNAKHLCAFFLVQICKVTSMSIGNYKRMSGIYRMNVHEGRTAIILMNHADFHLARQ